MFQSPYGKTKSVIIFQLVKIHSVLSQCSGLDCTQEQRFPDILITVAIIKVNKCGDYWMASIQIWQWVDGVWYVLVSLVAGRTMMHLQ